MVMVRIRIGAGILGVSALGIVLFWVDWFASGKFRTAGDACYRVFENTFPVPDGILAALLLATAWGVWRRTGWRCVTGLLAAGMLFQLSALDTLYHVQHDGFRDWQDGDTWSSAFISAYTAVLGLACAAVFRAPGLVGPPGTARARTAAGVLLAVAVFTAVYWIGKFRGGPGAPDDCEQVFHWAFWLADGITFGLALGGAAGLLLGRAWGRTLTLVCAGMLLFGTTIYGAFAVLNPDLIAGQGLIYCVLVLLFLAVEAFLVHTAAWAESR